MTRRLKSTVLHSTRVLRSKRKNTEWFRTINLSEVGKAIAIIGGFCFLKMIKCRRRQATDLQKLENLSTFVFSFFVSGSGSG